VVKIALTLLPGRGGREAVLHPGRVSAPRGALAADLPPLGFIYGIRKDSLVGRTGKLCYNLAVRFARTLMHGSEDLVKRSFDAIARSQRMIDASRQLLAEARRLLRETAPSELERMAAEFEEDRSDGEGPPA
jgi:hypothetical protein